MIQIIIKFTAPKNNWKPKPSLQICESKSEYTKQILFIHAKIINYNLYK